MQERYYIDGEGKLRKVKAIYVGENGEAVKIWENGVVLDDGKYTNYLNGIKIKRILLETLLKTLKGER